MAISKITIHTNNKEQTQHVALICLYIHIHNYAMIISKRKDVTNLSQASIGGEGETVSGSARKEEREEEGK